MMETLIIYSREKKNNLELYLNDVFEKECAFKIEQEEVAFIQTGIETLVQDLVDKILADDVFLKDLSNQLDTFDKKTLVEVYFPIQSESSLYKYAAENESYVKNVKSTIIKVGSFYDGTKNNFPDEFDFIFPLLGVRTSFLNDHRSDVLGAIAKYGKSLHYSSLSEEHQVKRKLDFEKYTGIYGPACKMQFIYSNGLGEQRSVHVDLVPADKIIDSNTQQWFVEMIRHYKEPKIFLEEILSAQSCLIIGGKFAFTEIEQHFMKNILSKKHVQVARTLKHLLNGHGDGEKLDEYFKQNDYEETHYTSYCIKIFMIYHHESCRNTETEDLGPCVLQVLKAMSEYKYNNQFLGFPRHSGMIRVFSVLPYLNSTIKTLKSMQTSEDNYDYDTDKIQSVSGQYLDYVTSHIRDQIDRPRFILY